MHIIAPRKPLMDLLEAVAGSADAKGALPVCANVLLRSGPVSEQGKLNATCTDLYQETRGTMVAHVVEAGAVCAPVAGLLARVKAMPMGDVEILADMSAHRLTVKASGGPRRFGLFGLPAGEFPTHQEPKDEVPWIEVEAPVLAWLLAGTSYAQATDETRPHVHATFLEWKGTTLRAVATDGHRLALAEAAMTASHTFTALVGAEAVRQVRRLVDADTEKGGKAGRIRLAAAGPHLYLAVPGDLSFSAKLVAGTFPPYADILDRAKTDAINVLRADRGRLIEAFQATTVAAEGGILALSVLADLAGGTLRVGNTTTSQLVNGESLDELAITYSGAAVRVGLNSAYVVDALKAMPQGDAILNLGGPLDPIVVEPATAGTGRAQLGLVMVARIEEGPTAPAGTKARA